MAEDQTLRIHDHVLQNVVRCSQVKRLPFVVKKCDEDYDFVFTCDQNRQKCSIVLYGLMGIQKRKLSRL